MERGIKNKIKFESFSQETLKIVKIMELKI